LAPRLDRGSSQFRPRSFCRKAAVSAHRVEDMAEALDDIGFIRLCCSSNTPRMPFDHQFDRELEELDRLDRSEELKQ